MFALGIVPFLLQLVLVVHVFKTGQDRYWVYLLLFLPLLGGLAYLIVVLVPELSSDYKVRRIAAGVDRAVRPTRALKSLELNLKLSATVANKMALADEYAACNMHEKAEALYRDCLAGHFRGDRGVSLKLARCLAARESWAEANPLLEGLNAAQAFDRIDDQLLLIRSRQGNGADPAQTSAELRALFSTSRSLECAYLLVEALAKAGDKAGAQSIVEEMKAIVAQHRGYRTTMGKHWVGQAKRLV